MSHTYVARKPCGCVRGAAVDDDHPIDVAEAVGDWIRSGCTIKRMVTQEVRVMDWRCHEHELAHKAELEELKAKHEDEMRHALGVD